MKSLFRLVRFIFWSIVLVKRLLFIPINRRMARCVTRYIDFFTRNDYIVFYPFKEDEDPLKAYRRWYDFKEEYFRDRKWRRLMRMLARKTMYGKSRWNFWLLWKRYSYYKNLKRSLDEWKFHRRGYSIVSLRTAVYDVIKAFRDEWGV